jgi:hypothetical protein
MQSGIAASPAADPQHLKALILSDPDLVEAGFRVLDIDFDSGPAGRIDAVGVDRDGSLALLSIAAAEPDAGLLSLLDQYGWAHEQRHLLHRLYGPVGFAPDRPIRCLLLQPSFTPRFLSRLSLLAIDVVPLLILAPLRRGAEDVVLEPALPRLQPEHGRSPARADADGSGVGSAADRPDGTWVAARPSARGVRLDGRSDAGSAPAEPLLEILSDADDSLAGVDTPGDSLELGVGPLGDLAIDPAPAETFETLTVEEMEEFERFDRGRHPNQRNRRST